MTRTTLFRPPSELKQNLDENFFKNHAIITLIADIQEDGLMRFTFPMVLCIAINMSPSYAQAVDDDVFIDKSVGEDGATIEIQDIEIARYRAKFKNFTRSTCNISLEYANGGTRNFSLRPGEVEYLDAASSDRYCWTRNGAAGPCRREVGQRDSYGCWGIPSQNNGSAGCADSDVGHYNPGRCLP